MSRLKFIASAVAAPMVENTNVNPSDVMQKVEKVASQVDKLAEKAEKQPPILNGSWERRLKVGSVVAATAALTAGGQFAYAKLTRKKSSRG